MAALRPSASVVVLSPTNDILLLHRGSSAPSFASAHVFPGGNLDLFHDGELSQEEGSLALPPMHAESMPFRMAAARECFEESGILLARRKDGRRDEKGDVVEMLRLDEEVREQGRRAVREGRIKFGNWVDSVGGFVDTDNLIPFTRWITPITAPKRFTTQMYLYLLPTDPEASPDVNASYSIPTPDGREMTHANFAPASTWLGRVAAGEVMVFPPQYYLISMVARFTSPPTSVEAHSLSDSASTQTAAPPQHFKVSPEELNHQRIALLTHIQYPTPPPASPYPETSPLSPVRLNPLGTALARIPPGRRIICPRTLLVRSRDGSVVLGLDHPGRELQGKRLGIEDDVECGGDAENVAVVALDKGTGAISRIAVRLREDVFREEEERRQEVADAGVAALGGVSVGLPAVEKL